MEIITISFIIIIFFLSSWNFLFIYSFLIGLYFNYKDKKHELVLSNLLLLYYIITIDYLVLIWDIVYLKIKKNKICKSIILTIKKLNGYYLEFKINVFVYLMSLFIKFFKPIQNNVRPVSILRNQKDINDFLDRLN